MGKEKHYTKTWWHVGFKYITHVTLNYMLEKGSWGQRWLHKISIFSSSNGCEKWEKCGYGGSFEKRTDDDEFDIVMNQLKESAIKYAEHYDDILSMSPIEKKLIEDGFEKKFMPL